MPWPEVRWAVRSWRRSPGLTVAALLTLALGIGASTAVFSLVDAVLLQPLPIQDPARVLWVSGTVRGRPGTSSLSPADFLDYQRQATTVSHFAATMTLPRPVSLTGRGEPERLSAGVVTPDYFAALGVQASAGRLFGAVEHQAARPDTTVLSHALWLRRFGGRADIIGQSLTLDGSSVTVVGIVPPELGEFGNLDLWLPLPATHPAMQTRSGHFLRAVARLKPDVSLTQAQAEMDAIAAQLEQQYPDTNAGWRLRLAPLTDVVLGDNRQPFSILMGAVGFVLLIACVNVANLLLVRTASRSRELAIRSVLGASRARLARQLLIEGLLLFSAGGAAGVLLASWIVDVLPSLAPAGLPRLSSVGIDVRAVAFAIVTSFVCGVLVTLLPTARATTPAESLRHGSRSRLRHLLMLGEVTLAMVPLTGAALLTHSFFRLQQVDPGFERADRLAFQVSLSPTRFRTAEEQAALFAQATERLRAVPGVRAVGLTTLLPLTAQRNDNYFYREGRLPQEPRDRLTADFRAVDHDYFRAIGIPLLRGRAFTDRDTRQNAPVAIVSQSLIDAVFPGENPIGQRLIVNEGALTTYEIVGVVGNIRHRSLQLAPYRDIYVPRLGFNAFNVVVHTAGPPAALGRAVRDAWLKIDKDQPLADMRPLDEIVSASLRQPRFRTALMGAFAVAAVLLACIGIAGVVAYNVLQQRREIGVRLALGAARGRVVREMVLASARYALIGIVVGAALSTALAGLLRGLLFDLEPRDLPTIAGITTLFLVTTMVTTYIPARRASRVDPLIALRHE